jgi:hypothetical protein
MGRRQEGLHSENRWLVQTGVGPPVYPDPGAARLNVSRAGRMATLPAAALLEANERPCGDGGRNQGGTAYIYAPDRFGSGAFFMPLPGKAQKARTPDRY